MRHRPVQTPLWLELRAAVCVGYIGEWRRGGQAFGREDNFFVSTPRSENATLEAIANMKHSRVKLSSAAEATATPPTTGSRQAFT